MSKPFYHLNHPRPLTRRQLVSQGFLSGSAFILAPTLLGMLSGRRALANGATNSTIPFLVFDLAGGAAMPGNFLAGKAGGPEDLLASYDRLGWNPGASNGLDKTFGLPMSRNSSKILTGILQTSSPEARSCTRMGSLCHSSRDDTEANQLSAINLVAKSGYKTSMLDRAIGYLGSPSAGHSAYVTSGDDASFKPLRVESVNDMIDSVGFGSVFATYKSEAVKAMARGMDELSKEQFASLLSRTGGNRLVELSNKAYETNVENGSGGSTLDPRLQPFTQKIFQITPASDHRDPKVIAAAVTYNVLSGNSGPGVITIGACDYHDGTQATGDKKDLEIGQHLGMAIETAHQLKTPFFFHILTDGGINADQGTRNWRGDDGTKGMTVIGFYDPAGAPDQERLQVGSYTDGQGADRESLIGASPPRVATAVFANYLAVQNRLAEFDNFAPPGMFTRDELKSVLIFKTR